MEYKQALDYILSYADYERLPRSAVVFDLRRMFLLLKKLGNPQEVPRTIHVAGTKGKGSTSAMIASVLTSAGYRTGLYTSPHLLSITERIKIDDRNIPEADFARLTGVMQPHIEAVNRAGEFGTLTTFEILTALAFLYYREMNADYQVLETGLGGRLDATNVVKKPDVCVLTSISFDHMDVLGKTLAGIATEKAGIIKPGSTVVTAPQFPEAMAVIEKVANEKGCRLIVSGRDLKWKAGKFDEEGQSFTLNTPACTYDLTIPLLGEHQIENAASAVAAAEVLAGTGAHISVQQIAEGLRKVHWPGRLQVLRRHPWLIIDGAHNAYSIQRLGEALRHYFKFQRLTIIFGASSDKDISGMIGELAVFADEVIVTRAHHPRSMDAARLCTLLNDKGITARVAANATSAVDMGLSTAGPNDLICATGSIFLIAEVLEHLKIKV